MAVKAKRNNTGYSVLCNARVGKYLKDAREALGITQSYIADKLQGTVRAPAISQWENGLGTIPPQRYEDFISLLQLDRKEFGMVLLRNTNPELFMLLFPEHPETGPVKKELRTYFPDIYAAKGSGDGRAKR